MNILANFFQSVRPSFYTAPIHQVTRSLKKGHLVSQAEATTNMLISFTQNLYKQQQKLFQQQRIVQSQRLKRVRQLHEEHTKNLQQMQKNHQAQHVSVQEQLRKEINVLQKKILMDTVWWFKLSLTLKSVT